MEGAEAAEFEAICEQDEELQNLLRKAETATTTADTAALAERVLLRRRELRGAGESRPAPLVRERNTLSHMRTLLWYAGASMSQLAKLTGNNVAQQTVSRSISRSRVRHEQRYQEALHKHMYTGKPLLSWEQVSALVQTYQMNALRLLALDAAAPQTEQLLWELAQEYIED